MFPYCPHTAGHLVSGKEGSARNSRRLPLLRLTVVGTRHVMIHLKPHVMRQVDTATGADAPLHRKQSLPHRLRCPVPPKCRMPPRRRPLLLNLLVGQLWELHRLLAKTSLATNDTFTLPTGPAAGNSHPPGLFRRMFRAALRSASRVKPQAKQRNIPHDSPRTPDKRKLQKRELRDSLLTRL